MFVLPYFMEVLVFLLFPIFHAVNYVVNVLTQMETLFRSQYILSPLSAFADHPSLT